MTEKNGQQAGAPDSAPTKEDLIFALYHGQPPKIHAIALELLSGLTYENIARNQGTSYSTISTIAKELKEHRIIPERKKKSNSSVGKKNTTLQITPIKPEYFPPIESIEYLLKHVVKRYKNKTLNFSHTLHIIAIENYLERLKKSC